MDKSNTPIAIPVGEVARQAADAIDGYVYQLHQTVYAWLNLSQDELLHIEFAEDIAVSDEGKLELVQVKRVAASITLRSESVQKLVTALWAFQKSNPTRTVSAALMTTSKIGKEKGVRFPGKLVGLHYWRVAAREGGDVEPIRKELLQWNLPTDLRDFVKNAPASVVRDKILRPIRWLDGSVSQDALDRDIEERLVKLGSRIGVAAQASVDALDALVGHLLKSLKKPAELRFVTAADLLTVFQKKTFVSVPPGILDGLSLPISASPLTEVQSSVRDLAQIPLHPRIAPRSNLVATLQEQLVSSGAVWLHGSSGLGKTTLALLIARSQGVAWHFADLRDLPTPALRSVLAHIAERFRQSQARGLILDDIPADPDNNTIAALSAVARAVADADGVLIVTSTKPPVPSLGGNLNLHKKATIEVPYLSEEEVGEIINLAGGDPTVWARNVYLFAGGHPQLVVARIAGLSQRGWNVKEALAALTPIKGVPNDMEEERKLVRTRLLQDLDSGSVEFLLRLSVLTGNFTRAMMMIAANAPPPVPQPGLQFDFLVGPWIEQVGEDRYRLSPLLRDSGVAAGMAAALQNAIKGETLRHLIAQNPFPADQLLQVFLISFQLDDKAGLRWFTGAVLSASMRRKAAQFKRLAEVVSVVSLVDRGEGVPLIADDLPLSSMLRFAQLTIATATEDYTRAAKLVDLALCENKQLEALGREYADAAVYSTVLLEPKIPVPARRWLTMLANLQALPSMQPIFEKPIPAAAGFMEVPENATQGEMLFVFRASAIKEIADLKDFIEALDEKPKDFRDHYLGAASRLNNSINIFVTSSWLAEVKRPGFDAHAAAATYETLRGMLSARECDELAIELICAQAAMLDEYANERHAALDLLEDAERTYPTDYRLNRQRQRVYFRNNQHAEVLAEFEKFRERMPKDRPIDRTYAMREAGKSAAEMGEMDKARLFFGEAWESARQCGEGMVVATAGLSADCAILDFDAGKSDSALALMQRALLEADKVDPSKGLKESFVKRIHIVAILYMRGKAVDWPVEEQTRVIGMCSDPAPQEWFRKQPQSQPNFVWYELAELEAETSSRQEALTELRRRTAAGGLLPMEVMLASSVIKAALRDVDVDRFIFELPSYLRGVQQGVRNLRDWGGGDVFHQPVGHLAPLEDAEWNDPEIKRTAKNTLLTFLLCLAADGRWKLIDLVQQSVRSVSGLDAIAAPLFAVIADPSEAEEDLHVVIASIVGRLLRGDVMDANDAYLAAVFSLMLLENSVFAPVAAKPLLAMFERVWSEILQDRTFSMRAPSVNGPLILEALRKGDTALQRLANMVLAAEAAVKRGLSDDLRSQIGKLAAKKIREKLWDEEGI